MAIVQSYTKAGVDSRLASRSSRILAYSGTGTPEVSAYPDAKTGDVIERNGDRARWRVLGNTLVSLEPIVTKINNLTGDVTLTASDLGASPTGHKHTIADITDLTVSTEPTADHVVKRIASGNITVPTTPNASTSAASKSYVDAEVGKVANSSQDHTHTIADITDLTVSTNPTVDHVVKRISSGNITVPTIPNSDTSAASKHYVDAEVGKKANSSHTHTISQISDLTVSTEPTFDHVVKRIISGNITVPANPNASTSATSKHYVDTEVGKKANTSHTHTKSNITDLETVSTGATGNHIVKRNTDGTITVPATPGETTSATSKSYVDTEVGKKANTSHTHSKSDITDLETISTEPTADHVVKRDAGGDILVPLTPTLHHAAASRKYVETWTPEIRIVSSLPSTPQEGVVYFVRES